MKFKNIFVKKILCYLIYIIIVTLFMGIYSFMIHKNILPNDDKSIYIYTFIIGGLCFFSLGFTKGIIIKNNGLLEGLLSGAFVVFIVLLLNLIFNQHFTYFNIIKIIVYITLTAIGGIIGVNITKKEN